MSRSVTSKINAFFEGELVLQAYQEQAALVGKRRPPPLDREPHLQGQPTFFYERAAAGAQA